MIKKKTVTKSDLTRAAIIAAAKTLFAQKGFRDTTIRDIAAGAEIDPAMVIRYFGSKDALFMKVAEFDLKLPDLSAVEPSKIGETLVRHFLQLWEGESDGGLPILLRSAITNEQAADKLREIFGRQVVVALRAISPGEDTHIRAGLIATQILGLALGRYVLKLPPVEAMQREIIIAKVGQTIQNYADIKL